MKRSYQQAERATTLRAIENAPEPELREAPTAEAK
jgi:hypothetical protein